MQPNGHDWMPSPGEYGDLDGWGREAAPTHAVALGIETLPNGDHDCEVIAAEITHAANRDRVVNLHLVVQGGRKVQHTYWFNRQQGVNAFLADMAALGYPAQTWGSGPGKVPLSQAIPDCVARLRGVRFRAAKTSRHVDAKPASMGRAAEEAKTYHDLRISGRITGAPMPAIGPAPPPHQPAQQPVHPAIPAVPAGMLADDQIPFSWATFLPWLAAVATLGGLVA